MAAAGAAEPAKLKVFISYSRKDEDFAQDLLAGLRATDFEPYLDQHDIAAGEDWEARLGRLIDAADTVVFVISPDAVASHRCAWEVERSVSLKKRLLPIVWRRVEEAQVPPRLKQLNYIFFDRALSFGASLEALATALRTDVEWVREHTRIGEAALRWDARGRAEALLLRGEELVSAKAWLASRPKYAPDPRLLHHAFIIAAEDAEAARTSAERQRLDQMAVAQDEREKALLDKEAAQEREAATSKRLVQRTLSALYVLLVLSVYLGMLAIFETADLRTALFSDQLKSQHPRVAIVAITDRTLDPYVARVPIDRLLLAKLVDAVDAAGAKAIGIDILFYRTPTPDNEVALIDAIRRSHAKVVAAAVDERFGLTEAQYVHQQAFLDAAQCAGGFANLATERDWAVRFNVQPAPGSRFPKSFAQLLAEAGGVVPDMSHRRIAWLREPEDGSDTFLTIPAETLLRTADDPLLLVARKELKDKIAIIGGMLPDVDEHVTPLTTRSGELMPGTLIHAHILAQFLDHRGGGILEQVDSHHQLLWFSLSALLAIISFFVGWRYYLTRRGILVGRLAVIVALALTLVLVLTSKLTPIVPGTVALLIWFVGEILGHHIRGFLGGGMGSPGANAPTG
jgi:CHASE2 domain-containing sensor protein